MRGDLLKRLKQIEATSKQTQSHIDRILINQEAHKHLERTPPELPAPTPFRSRWLSLVRG